MDRFEWILIIGVSLSILLFILMLTSFIQFLSVKKAFKKLNKSKPRDKKKKRRWKRELNSFEEKKSKKIRSFIFSLLATVLIAGGTGYAKFFMSTNISDEDTENIVYGYYLIEQIENQVKDAKESEGKSSKNIHTLAISLASFSSKKGNNRSVEDAQILLNQYYAKAGQLGLNISNQNISEDLKNKEKKQELLDDLDIVKKTQKKVIDYYKIDESSLKEKK